MRGCCFQMSGIPVLYSSSGSAIHLLLLFSESCKASDSAPSPRSQLQCVTISQLHFHIAQTILRKVSPCVWWEAEIPNGKFQPKWLKSGKVKRDKQKGRAMVRTARCYLRGQAPAEPETCPVPKSLRSRGKIKQARDVRKSSVWVIVLPWIRLSVTI